ncbi:hypothetical protein DRH29_01155 [candidate division Kazan bacterium]|uniref:IrrE N-terminal-like domain-containing protein n=1 Tax=candidate division Kazan bacterium TaxID=2202143 RepID=A0A420ZDG5_UNCK3|nr:MAG: hypothetical protein DRH29_01155 [candidate division Kazan bacterium]
MKNKNKNIFRKLRSILINSGYDVVLTGRFNPPRDIRGLRFRSVKGYIAPDSLKIYINKAMPVNDRVITLIHELLHEMYPVWTESKVERESKNIFQSLTVPQLGFIQFFVMTKPEINRTLKQQPFHSPIC